MSEFGSHFDRAFRAAFEAGVATGKKDQAEFDALCANTPGLREMLTRVNSQAEHEAALAKSMLTELSQKKTEQPLRLVTD